MLCGIEVAHFEVPAVFWTGIGIAAPRLRQLIRLSSVFPDLCEASTPLQVLRKDMNGRNMLAMTKSKKQETS
jgi:hypothetical protein